LESLGRGDVIDDRLDLVRVENPVHALGHQVHDGDRGGDFMAHHDIEIEHHVFGGRSVPKVGGENLFSNGLSH